MNSGTAELYLIVGYMTLILLIAFTAVYIFFRQYKREMKSKTEAKKRKPKSSGRRNIKARLNLCIKTFYELKKARF